MPPCYRPRPPRARSIKRLLAARLSHTIHTYIYMYTRVYIRARVEDDVRGRRRPLRTTHRRTTLCTTHRIGARLTSSRHEAGCRDHLDSDDGDSDPCSRTSSETSDSSPLDVIGIY